MKREFDTVDDALGRLKSCAWEGDPHNARLEERLMNEFAKTSVFRPRARYASWMIALAALSVGGGAFAYAGGFKYVESLFVTVDIHGDATPMEMQPVGENAYGGAMQKQLEDGGQADIHVRHEELTPGLKRTKVQVKKNVSGNGNELELVEDVDMVTWEGWNEAMRVASVADLGDAKPVHRWRAVGGVEKALYIVPDAKAGLLRFYKTSQTGKKDLVVRKAGLLPSDKFHGDPEIAVGDDGAITLTWEVGDGEEKQKAEIKIPESIQDPRQMRVRTNTGVEVGIPTKMSPR